MYQVSNSHFALTDVTKHQQYVDDLSMRDIDQTTMMVQKLDPFNNMIDNVNTQHSQWDTNRTPHSQTRRKLSNTRILSTAPGPAT